MSTFLDPRFKFKFKFLKNDMENTIKNWILHLLSTDDNEVYSGYTSSSCAEGQEDQSESKTASLSNLFDELASNKPTVTNRNLEQVEAELNLKTATASTTEIQEAQSKLKRSKSLIHKCTKELYHYVVLSLLARGDDPFQ